MKMAKGLFNRLFSGRRTPPKYGGADLEWAMRVIAAWVKKAPSRMPR
jgi:hypothetical protein